MNRLGRAVPVGRLGDRIRTVRNLAALFTALAATLALVLWGAVQASAGGSTSVLIVSPESEESASLYFSDKDYGRLARLLGEPGETEEALAPGLRVGAGRRLDVTWLLHDIQPWRVDRVYPGTPGSKDVWIHTSTDMNDLNGIWHTAEKPGELRSLMRGLGVMGKRSSGGAGPGSPVAEPSRHLAMTRPDTPATRSPATAADAASVPAAAGWWWMVSGVLAGAALALLVRPLVVGLPRRVAEVRRRREHGPRQELRDI
ncbi:hypothetical protein [Streptomyces sp. NPDC050145]|uniref:hypothetical protein n=1 Tax=Streptomyces sp. NPDC050145 TaxID=3365602 RepID=UPI00378E9CC7